MSLVPRVRATAVGWLSSLPSHQLIDLLPQLVEAVKHETWWVLVLVLWSAPLPQVGHAPERAAGVPLPGLPQVIPVLESS